jgi:hypothetical protein
LAREVGPEPTTLWLTAYRLLSVAIPPILAAVC